MKTLLLLSALTVVGTFFYVYCIWSAKPEPTTESDEWQEFKGLEQADIKETIADLCHYTEEIFHV